MYILRGLFLIFGFLVFLHGEAITLNGVTYGTVISPNTGKVWLDRNLGASRVCTSRSDESCVGYFYQWGRRNDGHQYSNSSVKVAKLYSLNDVTSAFVSALVDDNNYEHGNASDFTGIWLTSGVDDDGSIRSAIWSKNDGSSICPVNFRVPTQSELLNEESNINPFDGFLRLPMSHLRATYWSFDSTIGTGFLWSSDFKKAIYYNTSSNTISNYQLATPYGLPVRCIQGSGGIVKGTILDINVSEEYKIQPIERDLKNTSANTFRMHLALGSEYGNVCNDYTFGVVGTTGSAYQIDCDYNGNLFYKDEVTLDFRINKNGKGYYFENGKVRITDKTTGNYEDLAIFKNFNIYGTNFDLKIDAFSFNNGDWNKARIVDYTRFNFISYVNDIAKMTDDIVRYLYGKDDDSLWESVGYVNKTLIATPKGEIASRGTFTELEKKSSGLCHGMALVATANFTQENEKVWGTGNVSYFSSEIDNHWNVDSDKIRVLDGIKPLSKRTYNYRNNDVQALKKILYYFVTQKGYTGKRYTWTGREKDNIDVVDSFVRNYRANIKPIITKNIPIPFGLYYVGGGGHEIVNTQIIEYNNKRNLYFYDNNDNSKYTLLETDTLGNCGKYYNHSIKQLDYVDYLSDALKIYPDTVRNKKLKESTLIGSKQRKVPNTKITYKYRNHIKVYVIGGSITEVRKVSDNSLIVLRPLQAEVEYGIAYREEANIFNNVLLLPADEKYKITVKKKAGFETLKIFVTIPKDDGTADYLSYKNAETSKADATVATLIVGKNNTNKKLKRTGGADYAPDVDTSYGLELLPPSNLVGYIDDWRQVHFSLNTNGYYDPDYDSTIMIRKEGSTPTNVNDGTFLSSGYDYSDLDPQNKDYYYAVYNKSTSGETTDMTTIHIDTSKYSLYGTLGTGEWIGYDEVQMGATVVKLYDATKSNLLDVAYTGYKYGFNNLVAGEYTLVFENKYYEVNDVHITLTSNSKEVQISPRKVAKPFFLDVRNTVESGSTYKIIWDGDSIIPDNNKVKIELYSGGKWKTIANNVDYSKHVYDWTVSSVGGEAKLRISETYGASAEEEVYILAKEVTTQSTNLAAIEQFVTRFYNVILGRSPDAGGLSDWSSKLEGLSKSGADIAKGFIFSAEYNIDSKTDDQYLTTLYSAFFNRTGDAGGLAYWHAQIAQGVNRAEVLDGFLNSTEFKNLADSYGIIANATPVELFVSRFYKQTLERSPDAAGLADWSGRLNSGAASGSDVAFGFVFSGEFTARGLNNTDFLTVLYKAFFAREPDTAGFNGWKTQLDAGVSREDVLQGFLGAPEFANLASEYGIRVN